MFKAFKNLKKTRFVSHLTTSSSKIITCLQEASQFTSEFPGAIEDAFEHSMMYSLNVENFVKWWEMNQFTVSSCGSLISQCDDEVSVWNVEQREWFLL